MLWEMGTAVLAEPLQVVVGDLATVERIWRSSVMRKVSVIFMTMRAGP